MGAREVAAAIEERDVRGHDHVPGRERVAVLEAYLAWVSVRRPDRARALEDLRARLPRGPGQARQVLDRVELRLVVEAQGARHLPRQAGIGGERRPPARRRAIAAASASTSATSSGEGAQTKAGLRRRSHSMPSSCANPAICASPASLASAYTRAASAPCEREISESASLCCEVTLAVEYPETPWPTSPRVDQAHARSLLREQVCGGDPRYAGAEHRHVEPRVATERWRMDVGRRVRPERGQALFAASVSRSTERRRGATRASARSRSARRSHVA